MIGADYVPMKTVDFRGELTPGGQIAVPPEIASQVPPGEPIEVVIRWGGSTADNNAWRVLGRRQFEAAYSEDDSIYEQLIHDASAM